MLFDFETRTAFYGTDETPLDNDCRMLAPVSPLHPLFDDVRYDWLRDWLIA